MQKLEILKANAISAYKEASKETKKVLEALLGKENFDQKVTDRVKTFEDALVIAKPSMNVIILLSYNGQDKQMLSSQAHAKLSIIAEALNEGWKPDFTDSTQYKYYPWFKFTPGVGFSYGGFDCDGARSGVGSRLCFKSQELAEYAGKQFQSIYNDFLS